MVLKAKKAKAHASLGSQFFWLVLRMFAWLDKPDPLSVNLWHACTA